MASLFSDENVPLPLVVLLRLLGHDLVTTLEAGKATQGIPDEDLLAHATLLGRAVPTNNRRDFHQLHQRLPYHAGIITYTDDPHRQALAQRIHDAIISARALSGVLLKLTRPG